MATILVADDHLSVRTQLAERLTAGRHRILEASDGSQALSLARSERPHLILASLALPAPGGLDLAGRLRADRATGQIPILFYSPGESLVEAGRLEPAHGAAYVLVPPAAPEAILAAADAVLQNGAGPEGRAGAQPAGPDGPAAADSFSRMAGELQAGIAARQQAEAALRASEERLRSTMDSMLEGGQIIGYDWRYLYVNDAVAAQGRRAKAELIGTTMMAAYPGIENTELFAILRRCMDERVAHRMENEFTFPDGSKGWFDLHIQPVPEGIFILSQDITDRKRAEQAILSQMERLRALRAIDLAIIGAADLTLPLRVVLEHVTRQLRVDAAGILLFSPHTQTLEFAAGRGFRSQAIEHTRLRLGQSHAGRAALERKLRHVASLAEARAEFGRERLLAEEQFVEYYAVPLVTKGQVTGVLEVFHRQPIEADASWLEFLEALAGQAAIAIENGRLFEDLQRSNLELALAYDTTLEGWSQALDLRDKETEGHTRRVTDMTLRLAQVLRIDEPELVHIRRGALLHDIGKMGIPDSILLKPGGLTDEEWAIMRMHPVYAKRLLTPIAYLRPALGIPCSHHEKWDGSGYPDGLAGDHIPLAARLFSVVDVWDALRSNRPYRTGWPDDKVLAYIRRRSGTHFDPQVVDAFLPLVA